MIRKIAYINLFLAFALPCLGASQGPRCATPVGPSSHAADRGFPAAPQFGPLKALEKSFPGSVTIKREGAIKLLFVRYNEGRYIHPLKATGASAKPATVKPQLPGKISGHVDRADTGKPLAGVKVALGVAWGLPPFRSTQTAADGSYSFADVPPGNYWLVARRSGFARMIYGTTPGHDVLGEVHLHSSEDLRQINFALHPLVRVTQINKWAMVAAGFGGGNPGPGPFSPDGKLFAFTNGDPGPYRAWLYNLSSKRLMLITGKLFEDTPDICEMAWVGETLYVEATHQDCYNFKPSIFYVANAESARRIAELPPAAEAALRKEQLRHNDTVRDSRFVVTYGNPCTSCNYELTVTTTQGRKVYQTANLGAGGFSFQSHRSAVIFPRFFYPAISVLDLNMRRVRDFYLPNGAEKLLDAEPEGGGFLIAYTSYGPCQGYGDQGGLYGIYPQHAIYNVCFAKIPFEAKK